MTITKEDPLIGLVGPCSSGKSTLAEALKKRGVRVRHIAQEHSYVKDMWQRLSNPDLLIFLDVTYKTAQERRRLSWEEGEYDIQQKRLRHAREHADLYIQTDRLSPTEILNQILVFIKELSDA